MIRHGTYAGALDHWRAGERACDACLQASRRASKAAELDRLRGRPRLTQLGQDAIDVIARVPRGQLAEATGISACKLAWYLGQGPTKQVNARTRARILWAGSRRYWTPIGVQRRAQALSAIGWSSVEISRRSGIDMEAIKRLRVREIVFVRSYVAEAIVALYNDLHMTPAPAGRAATLTLAVARRHGWAPPLAWDDIDDPDEKPKGAGQTAEDWAGCDPNVVERILSGEWRLRATPAERAEVITAWLSAEGGVNELERRTGWNVQRDLRRMRQQGKEAV